jgi:hypothetical protein
MPFRLIAAFVVAATLAASAAVRVAPAAAEWHSSGVRKASIAYNQGMAFDPAHGDLFFDGISSTTNSGLYRTDAKLTQTAANPALIPRTREGYNHAGDLTFDPVKRRILLPLECYYPLSGSNTCRRGAIGVADPGTLRFLYYVNLDTAQIRKAMWVEISPDGRWLWTSSGTHLLVYRAADVNSAVAARQRGGKGAGIRGKDLGPVLPTGSVTGAAFDATGPARAPRLLLALNRGTHSEVISYPVSAGGSSPKLLSRTPRTEVTVPRSSSVNESEGIAVTGPASRVGSRAVLWWLTLPELTSSSFYSRISSYR